MAELKDPVPRAVAEAERKLVSILFADITGFTALSERLDAEAVRNVINGCFNALVPVVERYGGHIDKFIGDEIMALFGAPVARENDSEMALRAAIGMMDAIEVFNRAESLQLALHIGVNTARVVAGDVGSETRTQYSVMGAGVNLAARLCDAGSAGDILIGHETYLLNRRRFLFDALPPQNLQGIQTPVLVYRLNATIEDVGAYDVEWEGRAIGRADELDRLTTLLGDADQGRPRSIVISGEAGVGKSRLIWDFLEHSVVPFTIGAARGQLHMQNVNDWAAASLLRDLLGISTTQDLNVSAERLRDALILTLRDAGQVDRAYVALATLLQIELSPEERSLAASFGPEVMRRMIGAALRSYLMARAETELLVLVCEDVHWWDPASLELLAPLLSGELGRMLSMLSARESTDTEYSDALRAVMNQPM
ncbi:MAG: adenylate/guanylate cyclase domain-containing protein, partial [Longimicrobiales bacterium]